MDSTKNNKEYHLARQQMVERQLIARGIRDRRVLEAMERLPRHIFVEEALLPRAYGDFPLPIGEQQTISQPYIVALMTESLELTGTERVLEIGSGSGYQTAILADLCYRVYSVERIRSLMIRARKTVEDLGYRNVIFRLTDGTGGWLDQAPFDAILVTAGGPEIPRPLIDQLAPCGRLVMPVGRTRLSQDLIKAVKDKSGRLIRSSLGGCRFVDLVGRHGWSDNKNSGG
ncbi:MAG: protein-L-isoaspartate(D-aspartate) O-methyltransferase [Thermodesulfobacteriota bacterium]|nr:protein-L-isoaspartate(D-aspartate) O-methyltransferase [Thermodesulfobacteriota bacterium]